MTQKAENEMEEGMGERVALRIAHILCQSRTVT